MGTAWARHGHGMGTACARHAVCESALRGLFWRKYILNGSTVLYCIFYKYSDSESKWELLRVCILVHIGVSWKWLYIIDKTCRNVSIFTDKCNLLVIYLSLSVARRICNNNPKYLFQSKPHSELYEGVTIRNVVGFRLTLQRVRTSTATFYFRLLLGAHRKF